jgi:hypothetical protein
MTAAAEIDPIPTTLLVPAESGPAASLAIAEEPHNIGLQLRLIEGGLAGDIGAGQIELASSQEWIDTKPELTVIVGGLATEASYEPDIPAPNFRRQHLRLVENVAMAETGDEQNTDVNEQLSPNAEFELETSLGELAIENGLEEDGENPEALSIEDEVEKEKEKEKDPVLIDEGATTSGGSTKWYPCRCCNRVARYGECDGLKERIRIYGPSGVEQLEPKRRKRSDQINQSRDNLLFRAERSRNRQESSGFSLGKLATAA